MPKPKLLLVRPIAGHTPKIMENTLKELKKHYDVYMPTQVPEDYDSYLKSLAVLISSGYFTRIIGICQGGAGIVDALSMIELPYRLSNRKIVLISSPIYTTINETIVGKFIRGLGLTGLLMRYMNGHMIDSGRLLPDYMSLSPMTHFKKYIKYMLTGDEKIKEFYDAYNDIEDMPVRFFRESVRRSFFEQREPIQGIGPSNAIMVVEGLKDNITAPGQTSAVFDLLPNVPEDNKKALLVAAGHYGTFSGSRFNNEVLPKIREFFEGE